MSTAARSGPSEEPHPTEAQVKAAYLYNFGKFVRWDPARTSASNVFEICVLGKDPFGPVLDATVAGESIDRLKIAVKRMTSLQEGASCRILYISSSEEPRLNVLLTGAEGMNLLTVSDIHHFAERGGAIGFVMEQNRVRFEVNRRAAERSHLLLSSDLLKVAIKVLGEPTSGRQP